MIVSDGAPVGVITRGSLLRWASNVIRAQQLKTEQFTAEPQLASMDGAGGGCESPRERIVRTTDALRREAEQLEKAVRNVTSDLTPFVVGGASRMQELVNDLLVCARFANETQNDDASAEVDSLQAALQHGATQSGRALPASH